MTPSKGVIRALERRGFQRGGLMRVLRECLPIDDDGASETRIVPDAIFTARARQMIVAVEVEDQSPLTWRKLGTYVWLWFRLDCEEWDLELALFSVHGVGHYVDLCTEYVTWIQNPERFKQPGRAVPLLRRDVLPFYARRIRLPSVPSSQAGANMDGGDPA